MRIKNVMKKKISVLLALILLLCLNSNVIAKESKKSKEESYVEKIALNVAQMYEPGLDLIVDKMIPPAYSFVESGSIGGFASVSEASIEKATGKYACAVVALTNLAKVSKIETTSKTAFNKLWKATSTTVYKTSNNISYGTTMNSKLGSGFKSFAKEYGKTLSYTETNNPSFSLYKNAVKDKRLSVIAYGINRNGSRSGHCVAVQGYSTWTNTSNKKVNYLLIADGWYENPTHLNLEAVSFIDSFAVVWK